jgi:menaquinol-cytochrome c reductase iron-sulfur subunit
VATQRATLVHIPETENESAQHPPRAGRRSFLSFLFSLVAAAFAAICSLPFARYALYPLYASEPDGRWIDIGPLDDFAVREPVRKLVNIEHLDGWQKTVSQEAIYVTRDSGGSILVLSSVCPHLGCSIGWHPGSATFVCPCHGGCFSPNGSRISGPPPRNMSALPAKTADGRLTIRYQPPPA